MNEDVLKICAFSDTHGQYNFEIKPCDIVFICGDIVPLQIQSNIPQSLKWFKNEFVPWCNNLSCDKIILVAGNHDFFAEKASVAIKDIIKDTKITYLFNENYTYVDSKNHEWIIFGTPLCKQFGSWAFMHNNDYNKTYYNLMHDNVDIVITHDMPYCMNDVCLQNTLWSYNNEHIGNIPLRQVIDIKKPRYVFGGHLHSADHNLIDYGGIQCVNVSLLDEEYQLTYKPFYVDIPWQSY